MGGGLAERGVEKKKSRTPPFFSFSFCGVDLERRIFFFFSHDHRSTRGAHTKQAFTDDSLVNAISRRMYNICFPSPKNTYHVASLKNNDISTALELCTCCGVLLMFPRRRLLFFLDFVDSGDFGDALAEDVRARAPAHAPKRGFQHEDLGRDGEDPVVDPA